MSDSRLATPINSQPLCQSGLVLRFVTIFWNSMTCIKTARGMMIMFNTKVSRWMAWLAVFAWLMSACVTTQAPGQSPQGEQPSAESQGAGQSVDLRPVSLGPDEKLRVVATTNIVADIVSHVGADAVELTSLLPQGSDPHTYTATPQDVVAVTQAHVIFANGADLEADFLPRLVAQGQAPVVYLSQGIQLRELGEEAGQEADHEHGAIDPHTWTTPVNAIVFVRHIESALSALDPAHASTYAANAQEYIQTLTTLDEWVQQQIQTIPPDSRKLVTDHVVFGYYADHYGLQQIGAVIPGFSTAAEPSARDVAALEEAIRQYHVPAIFVGANANPSLAEQVAADTGVQLVRLYTGSLGPPGSGVETYVDYVCYNTQAIVRALGGTPQVTGSPCQ
jgi:manganese/iron transport system substrate-binding protein